VERGVEMRGVGGQAVARKGRSWRVVRSEGRRECGELARRLWIGR
jgi:hypothetical protein